jgi:ABC-2 type transport system permease protein
VSSIALVGRQIRYTNKAFWRNPASAFFTFAFPLMFLVIFTTLLGNGYVSVGGGGSVARSTYYVAAMGVFAVITACYTNIAVSVTFQRDAGILKRTRGTPLRPWVYLAGRVLHAMLIALVLVAITAAFGRVFYAADVPTGIPLLRSLAVLVVAAAGFASLGLAITSVIPNADASPAVVNASILPLLFLSGVFIPIRPSSPAWIRDIAMIFPVKHFFDAFLGAFFGAPTFAWHDVVVVGVWGLAGLILAARFFSGEPRT